MSSAAANSSGATANEVGISPVLLQAITHTLSNKPRPPEHVIIHTAAGDHIKLEAPLLQSHAQSGGSVVYVQEATDEQVETVETTEIWGDHSMDSSSNGAGDGTTMGDNVVQQGGGGVNMGNVLSAIASHFKNNGHVKQEKQESTDKHMSSVTHEVIVTESMAGTSLIKRPRIELADNTNTPLLLTKINDNTYVDASGTSIPIRVHGGTVSLANSTSLVLRAPGLDDGASSGQQEEFKPCPICGDKISGYHYGTFTCESCKGFFKRTVQNKKAFICHRKGDCDMSLVNRKKCPACRFKHCLLAGMKLEAIRLDRQRGGRSSYDGCSPHGRPKLFSGSSPSTNNTSTNSSSPQRTAMKVILPKLSPVSRLPNPTTTTMTPRTPQLLEDLIAVESLMAEDETQQACCIGKLTPGDTQLFNSVLHFADHCLYRIVRWARNLPEFAGVSTDDQILLLQNCWGELLCLCCCWHSLHSHNQIRLCYDRQLRLDQAQLIGLGDVTQRLIDFSAQLRDLELDSHEFVAMKVLMLLTPDVRNLQGGGNKIRDQQDRVAEALMVYTTTHYPHKPNKYCELLARLAELPRTCSQGKDMLLQRQAQGDVPQFSLLSELLKGDIAVQSG